MTRVRTLRPVLVVAAALVAVVLSLAGCVSMPTGGPVQAYPVTQGTDAQSQQFMQVQPESPGAGWDPQQIVQGFVDASASFETYSYVAYQYLTPTEKKAWNPKWSAVEYEDEPTAGPAAYPPNPGQSKKSDAATAATVSVTGTVEAILQGNDSYSVQSGSSKHSKPYVFQLQKVGGQWRISSAPPYLLLTSTSFTHDYQSTNLYFFDPTTNRLVPDPVYVPVGAKPEDLVNGLVDDLISQPSGWLSEGATKTAFPKGASTRNVDVTLSGATAVVNLKGAIAKASTATLEQVSAQLWATLDGVGQDQPNGQQVKSVEVEQNGQPWPPPYSTDNNPVAQPPSSYDPPTGFYKTNQGFYYIDSQGFLANASANGKASQLTLIVTGNNRRPVNQLAVSPDGLYVAVLQGSTLYAGRTFGGKLSDLGNGYTAISWAPNDYLWATGNNAIYTSYEGRAPMADVQVNTPQGKPAPNNVQYTAIKVAPDGVRLAIVQSGDTLTYGAISGLKTPNPEISLSTVQEDPTSGQFMSLAWYGPNDVITLASGSVVTEYPVSGGQSTPIPADSNLQTIAAASIQQPLVAATSNVSGPLQLMSYSSATGSWTPVTLNDTAAKDTPFIYPG